MKNEVREHINEIVNDINDLGDKVGTKSGIYKLTKKKLQTKYSLETQSLTEALIFFESSIAECGLLKVSRTSYASKELFRAEFREFLTASKYIAIDKFNSNRFLLHNEETDTYEQVSINISKPKTIVKEVVRQEMITNKKVGKKEARKNLAK